MKIRIKITLIAVLPIILTAFVVLGISLYQKSLLNDYFSTEIDLQARSEAQKIAQSVYLMCRSAQESVQQTVDASLRVASDILTRSGAVTFGAETVDWEATNQFTRSTQRVTLPQMLIGDSWVGMNRDISRPTPIADATKQLVGGTATIFQRMNDAGDLLRVATNVETLDGSRAIGTYIPAINPDGKPNPVITALLRGETFRGRAYVVNAWYITAYQPIWDAAQKRVVGALYVGVKQENLQSLRQGIMDIVVGATGYVWVVGGNEDQAGRYIISKDGARDNELLLDIVDSQGEPFVRRMIDKALALPVPDDRGAVPVTFDRYPWKNPGEAHAQYKSVAISYFAPWDWVIGAAYNESDFDHVHQRAANVLNRMAIWVTVVALIMVLLAVPGGRLVAEGIRSRIDCILNSVHDVLIVTDIHDHIFLLSRAAEQMFGAKLKTVKSRPLSRLIADQDICATIETALAERDSGVLFHFEWPGEKPGQPRLMQGRTSVVKTRKGGPVGMLLTIHDVTGERELERLKRELLSTAAHELNTPLTAIIGYTDLLLADSSASLQERRESLNYIHQKAWALAKIVDDLLDVSRIEAGKDIPINCAAQDINEIIRQLLYHVQHMTSAHHITVDILSAPVILPIDRTKIEQVLENILSNAIKYSPDGGTIAVCGCMENTGFHLRIEDQGIGMTPEQTSRVFDKFYRADSSATAVSGTGLGMTIARHIIAAHGGRIWIDSTPAKGTTVHLFLPATVAGASV
ncbi:MAG: Cache 3/Cache 2 fusion domain-containing protein [Desulfuromonadaceae bacterium]|nr:Cache 3/Cache 2 fusion domain-containing protein [Desulfuromonadaceae bacterium]